MHSFNVYINYCRIFFKFDCLFWKIVNLAEYIRTFIEIPG